ncbi:hypothetical protein BLNAU_8273 [Blattamonas nauphoetae]|uniref:Uncharacterized protein n=1 Tax=Blattamonas nauphoetae TaxID=2049346 RepID=A0ABQ9XZC7_9EUKA|nr:hypothetical protein BLNAU_8273 [Blattamonas nauphoetae]
MRGIVETSAFPSIGGSVSVSIVGCSFDSTRILGNDGIGMSLTRTADQSGDEVERLLSSLIGCSFVNMSSIGSSHLPHLPHLSQTMLGCVVSLTSSHLSGSTIRDVNTGGSVLCSNSSFSSLLPSPNSDTDSTQGTATSPVDSTREPFEDEKVYYFSSSSGTEESTALFSNCRFTGDKYPSARPLTFFNYPGTISIQSCSFSNFVTDDVDGVVQVYVSDQLDHLCLKVNSTNFTSCSSSFGGAISIVAVDDVLISSCRFEDCSTLADTAYGGAVALIGYYTPDDNREKQLDLVDCVFADCSSATDGAGVYLTGELGLSVINAKFEHCDLLTESGFTVGGGISVNGDAPLSVKGSQFVGCSSRHAGGAIFHWMAGNVGISDTLVQNCSSGATGAVCFIPSDRPELLSFSHVFFDGNSVGSDTTYFTEFFSLTENTTRFPDVAIMCTGIAVVPTVSFNSCFTTIHPDSSGMIESGPYNQSTDLFDPVRHFDLEFAKIGPLLTAAPTARVNKETGKIELEMKGTMPKISQEYEVTVKEDETKTERSFKMFSNGTGTLATHSAAGLLYNTRYTITKIVGVVPASSSSTMTNAFTIPAAAWAFNISLTPTFLSFTTPKSPPSLIWATCNLLIDDPTFAQVIVVLNEKVKGSFEIVVEVEGKDVTITVPMLGDTVSGESAKFVVVGKDRVLTHDTTYTIKSIVPTPETESPFVLMKEKIAFRIPKSPSEENKGKMPPEPKKLLSWLIPLVACVLVALIVAIVVLVVVRRRHQKEGSENEKEMEGKESLDESSEREVGVDCSDGVIGTDGRDEPTLNSEEDNKV